jgi:hypothetical protein
MNRDDVIDVLTAVAAADRRTVGHADVDIWHGVIGDLDRDLALRAVRDHLRAHPGVWLEPGHVRQRVRAARRDELDRSDQTDPARIALEARADAKATDPPPAAADAADEHSARLQRVIAAFNPADADDAAALTHLTPLTDSPLRVDCPWCHALAGSPCLIPNAYDKTGRAIALTGSPAHPARFDAAGLAPRYADTTQIRRTPPRAEGHTDRRTPAEPPTPRQKGVTMPLTTPARLDELRELLASPQ